MDNDNLMEEAMDYYELEQCIRYAICNDYHIIYCEESSLDFAFIRSKRTLIYNKNVQLLFNSILEKLEKRAEIGGKSRVERKAQMPEKSQVGAG